MPDLVHHAAPARRPVRDRHVGRRRGVRHPRVARTRASAAAPACRSSASTSSRPDTVRRIRSGSRSRAPPSCSVLVFFLLRRPIGTSLQAVRDDEEAAASLGCQRRALQARALRRGRGRMRDRRFALPRQHAVHPDRLGVRRAVDRVHAVHGAGGWSRHLRGSDPRRGHLLSDPGELRQQRRLVLHRAGRGRDRVCAVPAQRALGCDRPAPPVAIAAGRLHTTIAERRSAPAEPGAAGDPTDE